MAKIWLIAAASLISLLMIGAVYFWLAQGGAQHFRTIPEYANRAIPYH